MDIAVEDSPFSEKLSDWFWSRSIWLPPNTTWADVDPHTHNIKYTQFSHLWYPIPAAALVILIRIVLERYWFKPLGLSLGLKVSKHRKPPSNDVLEEEYQLFRSKKISKINSLKLAQELGMTERQVDYWIKRRKLYGKPTTLEKFCETGWRWLYYSAAFLYGICCLWNKPWFWDIKFCWYNYPHHDVSDDVWWYYMVELAFYWSLTFSQFFDVKRKDFVEMFIHHLTTISLMSFSWTCNLTRCGTLVLVIHDFADIFLEAAKMCNYTKYEKACDLIFGFFTLAWIVTRLGLFPTWILYSTTIEAPQIVEMFPAYYIFNGLLSVLLMLHTIWTYFILKIVYNALYATPGKMQDTRSDSSDQTLSSSGHETENHVNGSSVSRESQKCESESQDNEPNGYCNTFSPINGTVAK